MFAQQCWTNPHAKKPKMIFKDAAGEDKSRDPSMAASGAADSSLPFSCHASLLTTSAAAAGPFSLQRQFCLEETQMAETRLCSDRRVPRNERINARVH